MMRIITGRARGTRLSTPKGDNTRPTSERAKEAVFSMLRPTLTGTEVLDLFAGSGQMGLEAVSGGACHAVLCDRSREAIEIIQNNIEKTHLQNDCTVVCAEFDAFLRSCRGKRRFNLVFLDPPYRLGLIPEALRLLLSCGLLREDARVVCESAAPEDVFGGDRKLEAHFSVLRATHYGIAYVTVLTPVRDYNEGEETTDESCDTARHL